VSVKKEKIGEYSFKIIENTKNKVENIHDYTVKKCYNINVFYNNLTENEREFMQAVMLLIV
jgi:formyltetrahydrofolate synthetase